MILPDSALDPAQHFSGSPHSVGHDHQHYVFEKAITTAIRVYHKRKCRVFTTDSIEVLNRRQYSTWSPTPTAAASAELFLLGVPSGLNWTSGESKRFSGFGLPAKKSETAFCWSMSSGDEACVRPSELPSSCLRLRLTIRHVSAAYSRPLKYLLSAQNTWLEPDSTHLSTLDIADRCRPASHPPTP